MEELGGDLILFFVSLIYFPVPVFWVPDNGVACGGKMSPYLMGTPGNQMNIEKSGLIFCDDWLILCLYGLFLPCVWLFSHIHPVCLFIFYKISLKAAAPAHLPLYQGIIILF